MKLLLKNNIKFPVVLKPVNEGSSLGVKIVKNSKYLKKSAQKKAENSIEEGKSNY